MIYETQSLRKRVKMRKKQSEKELFDEYYRMLEFAMDRKNPLAAELNKETFGYAPRQVTADRRYYSLDNEEQAKLKGVERVALPKPGYLNEMRKRLQKAPWFKRLMRWRTVSKAVCRRCCEAA